MTRKNMQRKAAVFFVYALFMSMQCLSQAGESVPVPGGNPARSMPYGFAAMESLAHLPFLPPNGTQTRQFISYDPSGGNGYGVHLFKRYEDNGEWVFFDETGPGCLYRLQANVFIKNSALSPKDTYMRMYFDDSAEPQLEMTFAEFFGMGRNYTPPFTPPLAYYSEHDTYANMYYPFPFQKRLKITARFPKGPPKGHSSWYQYTHLKYPPGTVVTSWPASGTDSDAVREQWDSIEERVAARMETADANLSTLQDTDAAKTGDSKGGAEHAAFSTASVAIKPGETARVLDLKGRGAITSMVISMSPWTKETFFNTHIKMAWDGHAPSVDMPVGCLFGGGGDTIGAGEVFDKKFDTLLFGYDGKLKMFYSFWPMPFWDSAAIDIVNNGEVEISAMNVDVAYKVSDSYPRETCGYFGAKRTIDVAPENAYFSRAFQEEGWGKIMGIIMYSKDYAMDGDEFTYFDGSCTPQIHGSGTEDDHNQGWGGYAVQKPYWGGLINGFNGGYRLYINEPYIFNSCADIFYEHSGLGAPEAGVRPKTDFIVWYYLAEPGFCNLRLSDELDVGNAASEAGHEYEIFGEAWSGVIASAYEKFEKGVPFPCSDDGRAFTNYSEFTVSLAPDNEGMKLRRRVNRNFGNVQRADVYVDGVKIVDVPWYICDLPSPIHAAFLDTDFEIPASMTRGKERIRVRVEHVAAQPKNANNEYYYWAYCYGKTPVKPRPLRAPEITSVSVEAGPAVALNWFCSAENVTSFLIERKGVKEEIFENIAELPGNVVSFRDERVAPFNGYIYRIKARNDNGLSPWSFERRADVGATPAMANLALGAKASASSVWLNDDKEPGNANDGRLDTRWNSARGKIEGESLSLDWKDEMQIDTIVLHQETAWTRITSYAIRSKTAGRWMTLHEGKEMADMEIIRFAPVKTKGVVLVVNSTTGNTPTIKEFQVFDTSVSRDDP